MDFDVRGPRFLDLDAVVGALRDDSVETFVSLFLFFNNANRFERRKDVAALSPSSSPGFACAAETLPATDRDERDVEAVVLLRPIVNQNQIQKKTKIS